MKNFIRLEIKKFLNRSTFVISSLFMIIIIIQLIIIQGAIPNAWTIEAHILDDEGKFHSGFGAYRIVRERNADIEGYVTPEYLAKLRKHNFVDRKYIMGQARPMGDFGVQLINPYVTLFTVLNIPYEGPGTQEVGFLWEEKEDALFYENWKVSYPGKLIYEPNDNFGFTDRQLEIVSEKMKNIETPFLYKYCEGWVFMNRFISKTLYLFLIMLSFILCDVYGKNNGKGIDQIILSGKESRRRLIGYKNLSAITVTTILYASYIGILLLYTAVVCTLHGWDASAIFGIITFYYSLNMLEMTLICILMGYVASLVVTYLILFLSSLTKEGYMVLILMLPSIYIIDKYSMGTVEPFKSMMPYMPQNFVNRSISLYTARFIGDIVLPYAAVGLLLGLLYIILLKIGISISMKNYYLH